MATYCRAFKAAWTAARADPASAKDVTLSAADRCKFSDNDLRCFRTSDGPEEAHDTDEGFTAVVKACFVPLEPVGRSQGEAWRRDDLFRAGGDEDPTVDSVHPHRGVRSSAVSIAIAP